jgi:hypothetical protein
MYGIIRKLPAPSDRMVFSTPAAYPARMMARKKMLFPFAVLDFQDLKIDAGHAAPKQTIMTSSRILTIS